MSFMAFSFDQFRFQLYLLSFRWHYLTFRHLLVLFLSLQSQVERLTKVGKSTETIPFEEWVWTARTCIQPLFAPYMLAFRFWIEKSKLFSLTTTTTTTTTTMQTKTTTKKQDDGFRRVSHCKNCRLEVWFKIIYLYENAELTYFFLTDFEVFTAS